MKNPKITHQQLQELLSKLCELDRTTNSLQQGIIQAYDQVGELLQEKES